MATKPKFSMGAVNLTGNPWIPGVTHSEGYGPPGTVSGGGGAPGGYFTPEIMSLLGQNAPTPQLSGMDKFKQAFQNPQVQQSLGQLAPLLFGIFGGPEMGAGALKTFDTQAAIRRQQEEIDAERRQREAALGISRERLGLEKEELGARTTAAKAKAEAEAAEATTSKMTDVMKMFETSLAQIDTTDESALRRHALSFADAANLNLDQTQKILRFASSRAGLKPQTTPKADTGFSAKVAEFKEVWGRDPTDVEKQQLGGTLPPKEEKDTGLTAKVDEFKKVFGRDPSQAELQRMAGTAPPQPSASIQIAQMQDIGALADALGRGEMKVSEVPVTVRGVVLAEAKKRGYEVVSDVERERMGQLKKAEPILKSIEELSERINTGQGAAAKITGAVEKAKAMANLNDDVAEYQAMVSGFTPIVARALGHTGVLTEQDVQSVRAVFPQPGDSKTVRDRKMKRIKSILGGVQEAIQTNITAPVGTTGVGAAPIVQENKKTGEFRHSLDGGKTWQKGKPNQR